MKNKKLITVLCAVPAGLWGECMVSLFRRLNGAALDEVKPTVNNMPSLRDFTLIIWFDIVVHPENSQQQGSRGFLSHIAGLFPFC